MAISGASNPTFTQIDNQFKMGFGSIDKEIRADKEGTNLYTSNKPGKFRPSAEKLASRLMKQEAGRTFVQDAIDRQLNTPGIGKLVFAKIGIQGVLKRSDLAAIRQELNNPSLKVETYGKSHLEVLNLAITNPNGATAVALNAYLAQEFSSENLAFLRDVHALKAMPASNPLEIAAINTEARRLAAQYIGGQAPTQVNIAFSLAAQISADLVHVGTAGHDARTLFDTAEPIVTSLMVQDTVPRFRTQEKI